MGLFGKRRTGGKVSGNSDEHALKRELGAEIEDLQSQFRTRKSELDDVSGRLGTVREEYDAAVTNLMSVKRETNQKRLELEALKKGCTDARSSTGTGKNPAGATSADSDRVMSDLAGAREELKKTIKECESVRQKIARERESLLQIKTQIKSQQVQAGKEKAGAGSHDTKQGSSKRTPGIAGTSTDGQLAENWTHQTGTGGIIEAASAMVGSLKSKLGSAERELDTIRQLLEKERREHDKTRKEMERLKKRQSRG